MNQCNGSIMEMGGYALFYILRKSKPFPSRLHQSLFARQLCTISSLSAHRTSSPLCEPRGYQNHLATRTSWRHISYAPVNSLKDSLLNLRKKDRLYKSLKELEDLPSDPNRLLDYMREANKVEPMAAVRQYQLYTQNNKPTVEITREYIRALALTDSLETVDLQRVLQMSSPNMGGYQTYNPQTVPNPSNPYLYNPLAYTADRHSDTSKIGESNPMKLQLDQPIVVKIAGKHSIMKFARRILGTVIVVAGCIVFAESIAQNVETGFGIGNKKVQPVQDTKTSFSDVKGCEEVKEELVEIVSYLKDPNRFSRLGAKLPKGVLLAGQPGTGKTLIARAIAGEASVPFIQSSGSEFEEMFVGVGARRIRDLFAAARKNSPCIVFIDEIDAVGSKRSNRDNNAVRMTLNQLLVELDGFEQNEGVVVICATNFPESLDKALTRPGRLDKTIVVPLPDLLGRKEILEFYGEKLVLSDDVDLSVLAKRTSGMTGADLFNILNVAAVKSSADGQVSISSEYIEHAFDRVVVGLERRNPMKEEEKLLTAYHEGGHAIVAMQTPGSDPIHKATIMPRGQALGITWSIPDEKFSVTVNELQSKLDMMMGGKAAEALVFGESRVTAGCTQDLKSATAVARDMVMQYGMGMESSKVPQYVDPSVSSLLSEDVRKKIDVAVQKLLDEAYARAVLILRKHEKDLHLLAKALVEYETLTREEIELVFQGRADDIASHRQKMKTKIQKLSSDQEAEKSLLSPVTLDSNSGKDTKKSSINNGSNSSDSATKIVNDPKPNVGIDEREKKMNNSGRKELDVVPEAQTVPTASSRPDANGTSSAIQQGGSGVHID